MKGALFNRSWRAFLVLGVGAGALAATPVGPALQPGPEPAAPSSPREFFNAGTRKLASGQLREAEALLEGALASQSQPLQPPALYNLGHVRFFQGVEELKKGPPAGPSSAQGQASGQRADSALRQAEQALEGDDLQQLLGAYLHGRGVRKELKAATALVRQALVSHGAALAKWQRALGDFKSALELNPQDADARHNAEVLERHIAKLIDSVRQLQQMANALGQKEQQLGDKLKALKGRIPAPNMPPGAAGDEEDEEDKPLGPKPGQKEGPSKDGQEQDLSPEQAGWLLEGFKLDSERRLPMSPQEGGETKQRARKPW